jgi:Flp pilus assembly protein TadG
MDMFRMPAQAKTLLEIARKLTKQVQAIKSDQRGVSAIEFSFFTGLLAFGLLNAADISIYLYKRMQLENATEMGAQAAWNTLANWNYANPQPGTCDPLKLPVTTNCVYAVPAITAAVQSTSLGPQVSLQTNPPTEGLYCLNSSGALVSVNTFDCSSVGTTQRPADYITIQTTFSYAPLFPSITIASIFPTPIVGTATMRLN